MSAKCWTYNQVTAAAEDSIKSSMGLASRDEESRRTFESFAYGAYSFWSNLTMGWQKEGDDERLRALTERPKAAQS